MSDYFLCFIHCYLLRLNCIKTNIQGEINVRILICTVFSLKVDLYQYNEMDNKIYVYNNKRFGVIKGVKMPKEKA